MENQTQPVQDEEKRPSRLPWVIELLSLAVCIGLGIYFYIVRQCRWEPILLVVWAVVLVVLGSALVRAERREYRRRRQAQSARIKE